ncbi:hypothetical protein [Pseudomonas citronellolis]|uniref:hypothetical protein n=1 Tax=Pseudomonas citronellolis TaxID=53408 RepID=UPI00077898BB|nr:hypothetical protein [Pseudomonas citronellolis]AMO76089.1 hypothetical protein PcP3B5_26550 [Pseudomonas citronellolis]
MIFTVAEVQNITKITLDTQTEELKVQYHNPHRANAGRTLQVRFSKQALRELLQEIHRLETSAEKPLAKFLES